MNDFLILDGVLVKYLGTSTEVVIPEGVIKIDDHVFCEKNLTSVTLPDSLMEIGSCAFYKNNLTQVNLPANLKVIGDVAFRHNHLTSITIPDSVTTIGEASFADNEITDFTLPVGLKTIPQKLFESNKLTTVTIPHTIEKIEECAFACNNIIQINFGRGLKEIGYRAFYRNFLHILAIPEGVETIDNTAFGENKLSSFALPLSFKPLNQIDNCQSLSIYSTSLPRKLPSTIEELNIECVGSFQDIKNILTIIRLENNALFAKLKLLHLFNCNFTADEITELRSITSYCPLYCDSNYITDDSFSLDNEEWLIKAGVLLEYRGEKSSVQIPDKVRFIGPKVFQNRGLVQVEIPDSVIEIGDYAFASNHLTSLKLPKSLKVIHPYAFNSNELTSIQLPESVVAIGDSAIDKNNINEITIPENVDYFGLFSTDASNIYIKSRRLKRNHNYFYLGFCEVQNLTFDNVENFFEIILNLDKNSFKNLQKIIIISQEPIPYLSKLIIKGKLKSMCSKPTIEFLESEVSLSKTSTPEIEESEVTKLVNQIKDIASVMNDKDKEVINHQVNKIIDEYQNDLAASKPQVTFSTAPSLQMTMTPNVLTNKTIATLNNIIYSLGYYNDLAIILKAIESFYQNQPNHDINSEIASKINFLKQAIAKYNLGKLKEKLDELFTKTTEYITAFLENNRVNTLNLPQEDIKANFLNQLNDIYFLVFKYDLIISILKCQEGLELDENQQQLLADIQALRNIINTLDDNSKFYFESKLENIPLSDEIILQDWPNIISYIRTFLNNILNELSQTVDNITSFKDILNSLNDSLTFLTDKKIEKKNIIINIIEEIISLLEYEKIDVQAKYAIYNELNSCITKWQSKLTNMNYQALIKELITELNNQEIMMEDNYSQEFYNSIARLSDNNIVLFYILKDFWKIKFAILNYLERVQDYNQSR